MPKMFRYIGFSYKRLSLNTIVIKPVLVKGESRRHYKFKMAAVEKFRNVTNIVPVILWILTAIQSSKDMD